MAQSAVTKKEMAVHGRSMKVHKREYEGEIVASYLPSGIGQAGFVWPRRVFVGVVTAGQAELALIRLGSLVALLAGRAKCVNRLSQNFVI